MLPIDRHTHPHTQTSIYMCTILSPLNALTYLIPPATLQGSDYYRPILLMRKLKHNKVK